MDRTLVLIGRAHRGDKAARDLLFRGNTGLIYSVAKRFWDEGGDGGSVPDRQHRTSESCG